MSIIKNLSKDETPTSSNSRPKHRGAGHRKRLRERFLNSGLEGFLDYEIVELLLTLGTPMKDCKPMAKEAIKKFKGLKGALDASLKDLQQIKGIGPMNAFGFKLFQAIAERYARESVPKKITLDSAKAVAEYLKEKIGREMKEHFIVLYLNIRNQLLHEEIISIGTLSASLVHPREVFKPAIDHRASSIVIAHNHPSGEASASESDYRLTEQLRTAGRYLDIQIKYHIIITNNSFNLVN